MKRIILTSAILLAVGFAGSLSAQTRTPHVAKKQVNQQARIQEGRASGELTHRETRKLEVQQAQIQHDKKVAKSDGVVTPSERREIRQEQRKASRNIYRQKHDAQTK